MLTLSIASAVRRVQPPIEGGFSLSVLPEEADEMGLLVISVDRSSLNRWAGGSLTDQEFVAEWNVGVVTRE